jgi:hypothetical protein
MPNLIKAQLAKLSLILGSKQFSYGRFLYLYVIAVRRKSISKIRTDPPDMAPRNGVSGLKAGKEARSRGLK